MRSWKEFEKFERIIDEYMPAVGEGETMAQQAVTAANKLIYKWYNDGDVYDNTYMLYGWCNDLSSYANWLLYHMGATQLHEISDAVNNGDYEEILWNVANFILDEDALYEYDKQPKQGSIYDCGGVFKFEETDYEYMDDDEYYV